MSDSWLHIILLLVGFFGWAWTSSPLLAHMLFLAEKDFRWPLLGWFTAITMSVFLMKFSMYCLFDWPSPGSWSSRFFYPVWLFASPLVPYMRELARSR